MRAYLIILFLSVCFLGAVAKNNSITLDSILGTDLVTMTIEGSYILQEDQEGITEGNGAYYGKCILVSVFNYQDTVVMLEFETGTMLDCHDTTVQDMIITKNIFQELIPGDTTQFEIYAMCTEMPDASPSRGHFFDYGGNAEDDLFNLAQVIESNNVQNLRGQLATWAVSDDADKYKMMSYGATKRDLDAIFSILNEAGVMTSFQETRAREDAQEEKMKGAVANAAKLTLAIFGGFILLVGITLTIIFRVRYVRKKKRQGPPHA